jgi:hypothetical protein
MPAAAVTALLQFLVQRRVVQQRGDEFARPLDQRCRTPTAKGVYLSGWPSTSAEVFESGNQ